MTSALKKRSQTFYNGRLRVFINSLLYKISKNTNKMVKINFGRTLEINERLERSKECYSRKRTDSQ